MPAYVRTAPYLDRSARVICEECDLDEGHDRTGPAQTAAGDHNRTHHPTEPKET